MNAPQRKLRVGITLAIREGAQSIWENGIFQNCAFLVHLFKLSPAVEDAVLINTTPHQPAEGLQLRHAGVRLIGLEEWGMVAEIWQHTDDAHPSAEDDIVRVQDDFGR